ncbi:MAG: 16S rRNA (cytidine(1402)-2'-O)-methyltransferase [Bacteroidetes bacterium GWF2_43_63]|nr:MAG: 16S rRNA (cytidine(1402)-2'-O)-methyltransferase [Bacteroidetes bacterium GWE2_42_42]OFY54940.1 MAG: 16S rRNA (cytidine(1402)-2'-O)-methyltransferase [Bacteroidetes bacterium GWF2_43_63]HCB63149.1 16S rRNA (cytidine(1402)-2'-O)-methyltransferase [Bacteroidales bacterium]HCY22246.1 16S rRNA (cytidine(1402)-2'-O)-methyltransferase [Bacteroidales bacterium]
MAKLVLIPVPIGNKSDITQRALDCLRDAEVIYCEDTRNTHRLLEMYGIVGKKLMAYHQNNEHQMTQQVVRFIAAMNMAALVTDAGTPGISDPGFMLVRACIENNIDVEVLPGATAFVPALAASGLPCDRFYFEGFLPLKKGRQKQLEWLSKMPVTIVLYEGPHRLIKLLGELENYFGPDRKICVCRELSKMHEEYVRGTIAEVKLNFEQREAIKGEIVVVVSGE